MDLLYLNNQHFRQAHTKTQLNQAVKPATNFCHEILKMKFFSSLMLKNFSSHLT